MKSVLHSDSLSPEILRFERCCDGYPRTKIGLAQFRVYESTGQGPGERDALGNWGSEADPYFVRLWNGKRWWEWTVNEYASAYGTRDWPGWTVLQRDFADDPDGLEQIARRIKTRKGHLLTTSPNTEGVIC